MRITSKQILFLGLILSLLIPLAFVYKNKINNQVIDYSPVNKSQPSQPSTIIHTERLSGSYLISGDVFWGRGIDYLARQNPLKYAWPFSRLGEFSPEQTDGWIADLECPITKQSVPYQTQVDKLIFSCSPNYLPEAAKHFSVFTLANNHSGNMGASGFLETRQHLADAGQQFFGHWDLSQQEDLCEVISLRAKVDGQAKKLPIAMCGYHWLARTPTDEELAQISKYAAYFPVWVFPHGGTEYAIHSNSDQQALYRKMIDLGADVVFGDHPHVVQETEAYKGKLIVYSLGNLIFDQWFDQEVTKSLIVSVAVSASVDKNLQSYLDMGETCVVFKDNCFETAQASSLKAYKLKYSYGIMAGDSSNATSDDHLKHLGSPAVQDWLGQRTNWQTTLSGLN